MPGTLGHLTARFFEVLRSKPLNPAEAEEVSSWLSAELQHLFFAQPPEDQRHGYQAAQVVIASDESSAPVVTAALTHDIGKRHARLGIIGRSLASILIRLHFPLPQRMRIYRDHGAEGAEELARAGAASTVVEFARRHHGSKPAGFDETTWDLLVSADQPQRPNRRPTSR